METIVKLDESAEDVVREVIGGGGAMQYVSISTMLNSYRADITLQVDSSDLDTWQDLKDYIQSKVGEHILPCIGDNADEHYTILGLSATDVAIYMHYQDEAFLNTFAVEDDENFSITYLGQE